MKRFSNALVIDSPGACNPSGIALSIVEACRQCRSEGYGTAQICDDPAIKLMVHQLASITGVLNLSLDEYSQIRSDVRKRARDDRTQASRA
jgi:hypothetical protein